MLEWLGLGEGSSDGRGIMHGMCAINGFNWSDTELGARMNAVTAHRGPDGTAVYVDKGVTLGHNRLSIIDLSESASQPMHSADGRYTITYNGELYNYLDIKKEVGDYPYKSKSDTEVILAAYSKWGSGMLEKFNGIFALAIWDKEKGELFLARDQMGVKPLYYYYAPATSKEPPKFIFSSEIKGILEHKLERRLNLTAFNHYLRLLYVPEPFTLFDGVNKLPQAHSAILNSSGLKLTRYWNKDLETPIPEEVDRRATFESLRSMELYSKITKAVERQLASDRPLGVYLSGGIDSSSVLASMKKFRDSIDTFSVGFDLEEGEQEEKFNADFNLARQVAKHFNTNHHELTIKSDQVVDLLKQAIWHMDEPVVNATIIPMMALSEFAKNKVDVVLGGDGGDELFGGYERYQLSYRASSYRLTVPNFIRSWLNKFPKLAKLNTNEGVDRYALFMFQKEDVISRVINSTYDNKTITREYFVSKYFPEKDYRTERDSFEELFMRVDRRTWLVDEDLNRGDKLSMAHGLELRVPMLDRDVVEYSATIPARAKIFIAGLNLSATKIPGKGILKAAFAEDLPSFLFGQPKRGFYSPVAKWLRRPEVYNLAKEAFTPEYYPPSADLFNWDEINVMLEEHYDKSKYHANILWLVLSFQLWAKMFKIEV